MTTATAEKDRTADGAVQDEAATAVKLASHPIRLRVLGRLESTTTGLSPNMMAKEFGISLPLISYHIRILAEGGAVELVHTEPRRGAIEHFYRPTGLGLGIHRRYGTVPKSLTDLTGVQLVCSCEADGCGARRAIDMGELDDSSVGRLDLVGHIAEQWPDGWGFDRVKRRGIRILHCPEHRA